MSPGIHEAKSGDNDLVETNGFSTGCSTSSLLITATNLSFCLRARSSRNIDSCSSPLRILKSWFEAPSSTSGFLPSVSLTDGVIVIISKPFRTTSRASSASGWDSPITLNWGRLIGSPLFCLAFCVKLFFDTFSSIFLSSFRMYAFLKYNCCWALI